MKINFNRTTIAAVIMAVLVVASGIGAAALTYDNETTTTTSTSDLVGGETVTDLDNETKNKTIQVISDNATTSSLTAPEDAFTLEMTVNDADSHANNYTFYHDDSSTWRVVNESNGHYALDVSHAELFAELPRDVDENVTVDVTTTFNETESDEETSTITIHAQNGDERSVRLVGDETGVSDAEVENESEWFGYGDERSVASFSDENVQVTNNTTEVSYVLANDEIANTYTDAYDVDTFSSGDYIYSMTLDVNDKPAMIFSSEPGEDSEAGWFTGGFDSGSDTYAVYHLNGGDYGENPRLDITPGDDVVDEGELDAESSGNESLGFFAALSNFGWDAASAAGIGTDV